MSASTTRTESQSDTEPQIRGDAREEHTEAASPFCIVRARVESVARVSPTFIRITFGGPGLAHFGTPGRTFDQRIKLIFPPASGELPDLSAGDDWYRAWLALPDDERGTMRTFSLRDVSVADRETRVVIDFVAHLEPGATGPAATWASRARIGDELVLIGPRRGAEGWGGIEFAPGSARAVLLAGDETAAPAIARILEDAGPDLRGTALIEVPEAADAPPIAAPPGVTVRWLPRAGAPHGERLARELLAELAAIDARGLQRDVRVLGATDVLNEVTEPEDLPDDAPLVWETPTYSAAGDEITTEITAEVAAEAPEHRGDLAFWIAGESGVVTALRRSLVRDCGIDRSQVAFMGYWRRGVAMRG